jgi:hypothetical protein
MLEDVPRLVAPLPLERLAAEVTALTDAEREAATVRQR